MEKFKASLERYLDDHPVIIKRGAALTEEAQTYRAHVLKAFLPGSDRSYARASVQVWAERVFNSDWRHSLVTHHCGQNCCDSLAQSTSMMKQCLMDLLVQLRVRPMSRADWRNWSESLNILGLCSHLHGIFAPVFLQAFGCLPEADPDHEPEPTQKSDEKLVEWRKDFSKSLRVALQFWRDPLCGLAPLLAAHKLGAPKAFDEGFVDGDFSGVGAGRASQVQLHRSRTEKKTKKHPRATASKTPFPGTV